MKAGEVGFWRYVAGWLQVQAETLVKSRKESRSVRRLKVSREREEAFREGREAGVGKGPRKGTDKHAPVVVVLWTLQTATLTGEE